MLPHIGGESTHIGEKKTSTRGKGARRKDPHIEGGRDQGSIDCLPVRGKVLKKKEKKNQDFKV